MTHRQRQLAQRLAALQLRCAAQRQAVARELGGIESRLHLVDRTVGTARTVLRHPAVLAAATLALLVAGRAGGVRLIGRGVLLAAAIRRLVAALARM